MQSSEIGFTVWCTVYAQNANGTGGPVYSQAIHIEARPVPALRAHQHQRLVGRHPEEPRREARIAAERAQPADDLHQRRLEKILPILVGYRVAQKLALHVGAQLRDEPVQRGGIPGEGEIEQLAIEYETHGILVWSVVWTSRDARTVPGPFRVQRREISET